ncbi:hypothetical protein O6H91_09G048200 [Diphasiastrum complanatum]|uniref:Uncharacterized protein n=1 Tax=Diphasiastrum complanatum TaxID=34168 RepID=A0ACC2CP24_DIPCM|nr:hypothetical protein O6H91_09G048200 [Diphasiastrum complanatum]
MGILQFLEDCELDLNHIKADSGNGSEEPSSSLLHTAAYHGHVKIAKYLLERGFSVNSSYCFLGSSPLQRACESSVSMQKKDMVTLLLEAGADPNHKNRGSYTAMGIASGLTSKGARELVQLLVGAGFDLGKRDRWGDDYLSLVTRSETCELNKPTSSMLEHNSWSVSKLDLFTVSSKTESGGPWSPC